MRFMNMLLITFIYSENWGFHFTEIVNSGYEVRVIVIAYFLLFGVFPAIGLIIITLVVKSIFVNYFYQFFATKPPEKTAQATNENNFILTRKISNIPNVSSITHNTSNTKINYCNINYTCVFPTYKLCCNYYQSHCNNWTKINNNDNKTNLRNLKASIIKINFYWKIRLLFKSAN